ncbi:MAG: DUF6884 domain-containing protein, partial [Candidatus Micrarchaeia archaeon]
MARIVLISCAKKKIKHEAKAKDLYDSLLFKLSGGYAQTLNPDKIFILSAKYHLLDPEKVVGPYDKTLNEMNAEERREWGAEVLRQLSKEANLENDKFIILAGKRYLEPIRDKIAQKEEPLKGLRIGERISRLKK